MSCGENFPEIVATDTLRIRVFLLLENRLLREMLARAFRRCKDLEIVQESGRRQITLEELNKTESDVLLADFAEPDWLSFSAARNGRAGRSIRIVVLGMEADRDQFLHAVRCGVIGYLLKDASILDVVSAVRAAFLGAAICPPPLCFMLFQAVAQFRCSCHDRNPRWSGLTLRQSKLIKLVADGLTNKEIAHHLCLSEITVKNHISRILKQLNAANRTEAVDVLRARGCELP